MVRYLLISIVMVIVVFGTYVFIPRGESIDQSVIEILYETVEDGDIVCRLANRSWSDFFRNISLVDTRFSLVGVVRVYNNQITVIHAEGSIYKGSDYVKEDKFEDFFSVARSVGIYRIKFWDRSKISETSMNYLGVPFDWQFDMQDSSRMYCTELLYWVFLDLNINIELEIVNIERHGLVVIPIEAISNSDQFQEIYFIDNL